MKCLQLIAFAIALVALTVSTAAHAIECPAPSSALPTTTPTPRPTAWAAQQEQVRHRLASQAYPVITLGDSIMQGWSEARLSTAMGLQVLNAGFGQDGAEHILWRLKTYDWQTQSPRYVLLLAGTNDIGYPTCDIVWGISNLVQTIHRIFPHSKVLVTSLLPRGTNLLGADDKIQAVNAALEASASSAHFLFFNVHDAFECGHKTPCPLFQPDLNLHLTPEGYDRLSSLLARFMATHPG